MRPPWSSVSAATTERRRRCPPGIDDAITVDGVGPPASLSLRRAGRDGSRGVVSPTTTSLLIDGGRTEDDDDCVADDLPVPSSGIQPSAGLLTNDDPILGGNVFFSPFSQNDVLGLLDSAILFGTDGSGNPFFTFALPFPLTGHGTGLSVFMDVLSNSASGDYCFPTVAGVCTQDTPSLPVVGVDLATNSVPEPTSFSLLASGLLGLGFLRRKLQNS